MTKKIYHLVCLLFAANISFAQWAGSTTTTGDIYRTGNIGIGTTTVAAPLHVEGRSLLNGTFLLGTRKDDVGYGQRLVFDDYGNTDGLWLSRFNNGLDASELRLNLGDDGGSTDKFVIGYEYWETGAWTPRFTFLADGRLGIGTADPGSFKLAVEGNIGAREIRVTNANPWPDYVFNNRYKLRSLASLEDYIKKNSRLPNMPSAQQVKDNGIELGHMNTLVVENIEELTLHIIALNKNLTALNKKIEKLEKDNAALRKQLKKISL
jgi:hypothetical protein